MATVMTLDEVAQFLHVHPSTVYRLLKGRSIPAFKVGSDWRFNQESIDLWMKRMETEQAAKEDEASTPLPQISPSPPRPSALERVRASRTK